METAVGWRPPMAKHDKALLGFQRMLAEDPNDMRTLLKVGDLQLELEDYAEAVATYERVASFYDHQGFALKAIAIYKQILEIVRKNLPHVEERYAHVGLRLGELLKQLGLESG